MKQPMHQPMKQQTEKPMKKQIKHLVIATTFLAAGTAFAQLTPVGTWQSIDDKTGEAKVEVVITENAGVLSGRIDKQLRKQADPNRRCTECKDDRKDQLFVGLEIIRGVRKGDGDDIWEGGRILDPESGSEYRVRMKPIEGGKRMELRGYLGPIWRTQTWVRVK